MKQHGWVWVVIVMLLASGCAQLKRGQLQPVKPVDPAAGVYETTCGGAVEEWGSCFYKAKETCPKGYEVLNKYEQPDAGGITRALTFQCKRP